MQTKKLIVVEACDGCGKTTLVNNLCKLFEKRDGFKPVCVKEPWEGSEIGAFIRSWIKHVDFSTSELKKEQALLLFSAARLEMLEQFLLKELVRKDDNDSPIILCDRFVLSTCVCLVGKQLACRKYNPSEIQYYSAFYETRTSDRSLNCL